jgi:hypothetical protein
VLWELSRANRIGFCENTKSSKSGDVQYLTE